MLKSRRAALASLSMAVIDFASEDFLTLLEIIKRTNMKFSQTKSIAFLSPPSSQRQSAVPLSEQTPEAWNPGPRGGGLPWSERVLCQGKIDFRGWPESHGSELCVPP